MMIKFKNSLCPPPRHHSPLADPVQFEVSFPPQYPSGHPREMTEMTDERQVEMANQYVSQCEGLKSSRFDIDGAAATDHIKRKTSPKLVARSLATGIPPGSLHKVAGWVNQTYSPKGKKLKCLWISWPLLIILCWWHVVTMHVCRWKGFRVIKMSRIHHWTTLGFLLFSRSIFACKPCESNWKWVLPPST